MWQTWNRKLLLAILSRVSFERAIRQSQRGALAAFRRTADRVPAYQQLLREANIVPHDIRHHADFSRLPLLGKHNTFERFPLHELCLPGQMEQLASVLTSSGQSGHFAFGLTTRQQAKKASAMIDLGLEATFEVDRYKTLLLNALPMGVGFASNAVTVAETSVREDMVLALADRFGSYYDQIVLVTDPLFLKLLCDTSRDRGFDWKRFRVNAVIGEETIGEHFRTYIGQVLGTDPDNTQGPLLGASMGVGELGLNLFFETPKTIALRRRLYRDPALRRNFFGEELAPEQVPMLYTYSPLSLYVECLPDAQTPIGYGQLTLTPLTRTAPLPLIRYQTGDLARLYAPQTVRTVLADETNPIFLNWKQPVVALRGRDSEETGGVTVSMIKDCLYRDAELAHCLTGAFRMALLDTGWTLHLQLRPGIVADDALSGAFAAQLPAPFDCADAIVLWAYAGFPDGMRLDYERKFRYL